jgi:hypothetical protein
MVLELLICTLMHNTTPHHNATGGTEAVALSKYQSLCATPRFSSQSHSLLSNGLRLVEGGTLNNIRTSQPIVFVGQIENARVH